MNGDSNIIFDQALNNALIKLREICPIHILNLDNITDHMYVGKYLISLNKSNLNEIIQEYKEPNELKETSIIFFDNRHIEEICKILYGVFYVYIKENNDKIFNFIFKIIKYLIEPHIYMDFKSGINNILEDFFNNNKYETPEEIKENIKIIFNHIWFIPFGAIDNIIKHIKEDFIKSGGDLNGTNNTINGTSETI